MTMMSILSKTENGDYFGRVGLACNMSAATAEASLARLCPAIALRLKEKSANDNNAFEALLDLLDEGDDLTGLTDAEAIADGKAVLVDLYGSTPAALAEMKKLAPGLSDAQSENISAIAATSVLAVLAKSYTAPATLAGSTDEAPQGSGLMATIMAALIAGLLQALRSKFAPRRRRRRNYTSYFGTKRRKTVRRKRRAKTPTLEDIFGQILSGK
ncbi:MAG: hypothetical protein K8F90_10790 [Hyphomicrobiales bacterium]|nr:hypothetical protein [Hyphomicrobiales bacterium]